MLGIGRRDMGRFEDEPIGKFLLVFFGLFILGCVIFLAVRG